MTKRQRSKTSPSTDPAIAIMQVATLLSDEHTGEALEHLWATATRPELPAEWSRSVKALTRQLRRVVSHRAQAEALLATGRYPEARARLRSAEGALRTVTKSRLNVEIVGPLGTTTWNLWKFVTDRADQILARTMRRIDRRSESE